VSKKPIPSESGFFIWRDIITERPIRRRKIKKYENI